MPTGAGWSCVTFRPGVPRRYSLGGSLSRLVRRGFFRPLHSPRLTDPPLRCGASTETARSMATRVDIRELDDLRDAIREAAQALCDGQLVAIPTETTYAI